MKRGKGYSRIPYKELGNGLLSSGAFLGAYMVAGYPLLASAAIGGGCYMAYRLLFGTDPGREEVWKGLAPSAAQRAMAQLAKARADMEEIKKLNRLIPAADLSEKLDALEETGLKIVALLEDEPKDIARASRFIDVYLAGAVSVSRKFAEIQQHMADEKMNAQYHDFLEEMVDTFKKQHDALLQDDVLDLDVEIEVLKKRMRIEP